MLADIFHVYPTYGKAHEISGYESGVRCWCGARIQKACDECNDHAHVLLKPDGLYRYTPMVECWKCQDEGWIDWNDPDDPIDGHGPFLVLHTAREE